MTEISDDGKKAAIEACTIDSKKYIENSAGEGMAAGIASGGAVGGVVKSFGVTRLGGMGLGFIGGLVEGGARGAGGVADGENVNTNCVAGTLYRQAGGAISIAEARGAIKQCTTDGGLSYIVENGAESGAAAAAAASASLLRPGNVYAKLLGVGITGTMGFLEGGGRAWIRELRGEVPANVGCLTDTMQTLSKRPVIEPDPRQYTPQQPYNPYRRQP